MPRPSRHRCRRLTNLVTLATPAGLLLARAGHARLLPGPHGTTVAAGYRGWFPAPRAPAVTVGDVILLRLDADQLASRPLLLAHEVRHCGQWACWLGLLGFPLAYAVASAWSWWRVGDFARANPFEVRAGLVEGGYLRPAERVSPGSRRRARP